eukprot:tig00021590_g22777.t1
MEMQIGDICALPGCRQLDFLPFKCPHCTKRYCLIHRDVFAHDCPEAPEEAYVVPVCPLCNKPVSCSKGEDPNSKVDDHIANGCTVNEPSPYVKCSLSSCSTREPVPMVCRRCQLPFCIRHRLDMDHACVALPVKPESGPASPRRLPRTAASPGDEPYERKERPSPFSAACCRWCACGSDGKVEAAACAIM